MEGGIHKSSCHNDNGGCREQRPNNGAPNDVALGASKRYCKGRVGRGREEGGGDGEDLKAAREGDGGSGCGGGVAEGDVGDGAVTGEDAEADVSAANEAGDGAHNVKT